MRGSAIGTGAPLVERWSGGLALARRTGHATAEEALADPAAAAVVDDAARRLGLVLAALVNALDPGAVIVGGGLGLHDGYRERVEAALRADVYDPEARRLPCCRRRWARTLRSSAPRSPRCVDAAPDRGSGDVSQPHDVERADAVLRRDLVVVGGPGQQMGGADRVAVVEALRVLAAERGELVVMLE